MSAAITFVEIRIQTTIMGPAVVYFGKRYVSESRKRDIPRP